MGQVQAAVRCTYVQLLDIIWEMVLAKLNCITGNSGSFATPFTSGETLIDAASQVPAMGREQMYSGVSGEPLDGLSYIGCVHYQRLRHMVADKVHARALGPISQVVRSEYYCMFNV